jgi:hypothetical protein
MKLKASFSKHAFVVKHSKEMVYRMDLSIINQKACSAVAFYISIDSLLEQ